MCGIAGIIQFACSADEAKLRMEQMIRQMHHRGPDAGNLWCSGDQMAVLGHTRLAVIGLAGGQQPAVSADGQVALSFNGEIYNYRELRKELEQEDGIRFAPGSGDTEVLLALYLKYGRACVCRLHGMFAFAVYDARKKSVLLARDRFGQKPLFYSLPHENSTRQTLLFASTLAALKVYPGALGQLDASAIRKYLALQYVPGPGTVFENVCKLNPGHWLEFDCNTGQSQLQRYWQLDFREKSSISFADAVAETRRLVMNAVEKRLMAEVPFGAFLSGGVDSAVIANCAAELTSQPLKIFTMGFEESQYDEREAANRTRQYLEQHLKYPFESRVRVVKPASPQLLEDLIRHTGEPFADASILPAALLCQVASEELTVALSGDGADEIFGGYERYWVMKMLHELDWIPGFRRFVAWGTGFWPKGEIRSQMERIRRLLEAAGKSPGGVRYFSLLTHAPAEERFALLGERLRCWENGELTKAADEGEAFLTECFNRNLAGDIVGKCQLCDLSAYLENDILVKMDVASMRSSLEVRDPYLDHELVEFLGTLPASFHLQGGSRKRLLKAAFADILPPELAGNSKKRGFGVPVGSWLRGSWKEFAMEKLLHGRSVRESYIHLPTLENILNLHMSGKADRSYLIWSLLNLELFLSSMDDKS